MTKKHQNAGSGLEELIRLAQGKVTTEQQKRLEQRLASDSKLSAIYDVIRLLVRTSDNLMSAGVAAVANRLGLQVFRDFQKLREQPASRQAITVFDSKNLPLPEGVRPAAVDTRKLKYQLPQGSCEVAVYPISLESYELVGMISGHDAPVPYEIVVKSGKREKRYVTDEVSLFRIPRISSGKHEMRIYLDSELFGTITFEL
jgi:hypothetical protein